MKLVLILWLSSILLCIHEAFSVQFVIEALSDENINDRYIALANHSNILNKLATPVVINTWPFKNATKKGLKYLCCNEVFK